MGRSQFAGVLLALALMGLIGCGTAPCSDGRACPTSCEDVDDCAAGEVCSEGICGRPAPTANAYWACALDADCPRGDNCSLGACVHECLQDRDCSSGEVCSDRGRCSARANASSIPPPTGPEPTSLEVSTARLEFSPAAEPLKLELLNASGRPIDFRVLSDAPWLDVEPAAGTFSSPRLELTVTIDPARENSSRHATLAINSTAGHRRVDVSRPLEIDGAYTGEIQWSAPFELFAAGL